MSTSGRTRAARGESFSDLGLGLGWWALHSFLALATLLVTVTAAGLFHPAPDAREPKLIGCGLAFAVPLLGGFALGRARPRDRRIAAARYTWVAGLLWLLSLAVWVSGLPTGPGLCDTCGPGQKVLRTLFALQHGSGLLSGDGLLLGTWVPAALLGYSIGVDLGIRS